METIPEIPRFELAKVGKNRERRKAGLPLWVSGGQGGGLLATGGAGLAGLTVKALVAVAISALGVGAYNVGRSLAPPAGPQKAVPRPFVDKKTDKNYQGDTDNPLGRRPTESGLALVSGSLDGKSEAERAAEAAAAEAAAKAEAAAAAKAAPSGPVEPATVPGGLPGGMDPAALAAAAAGAADKEKKDKAGNLIGKLSASLGGGGSGSSLSNMGGLSGGIGRPFEKPNLGSVIGTSRGFSGQNTPGRSRAQATRVSPRGRTLSAQQLVAANQLANARGDLQTRTGNLSRAFENNPGASQGITGGGTGDGAGITGAGSGGTAGNPTTGGGGGPTGSGGDVQDPLDYKAPNASGMNVTPWQSMLDIAKALLVVAGIALFIAGVLAWIARAVPLSAPVIMTIIKTLAWIAIAAAAIATIMGIMMMGMGQTKQGTIFTILGAVTTVAGILMVALAPDAAMSAASTGEAATMVIAGMLGGAVSAGAGGGAFGNLFD